MIKLRVVPSCLCLLVVACAARADVQAPEPVPLPITAELKQATLVLELHGSEVDIVLDEDAKPSLAVTDLLHPENEDGMVMLEQSAGILRLSQPHGDDTLAPRLRVRVTAHPDLIVELTGDSMLVSVTVVGAEELETVSALAPSTTASGHPVRLNTPQHEGHAGDGAAPAPVPEVPTLRFDLRDSRATFAGIGGRLRGKNTHYQIKGAWGPVLADVTGGRLIVDGLAGTLDLRAANTDIQLREILADLALQLEGATLDAESGIGQVSGSARGSSVSLRTWYGGVGLSGDGNRVNLQQAGTPEDQISLSGRGNECELEQVAARLTFDAEEGRLVARRLLAPATIRARRGAQVDVDQVKARLELEISENASATLRNSDQEVSARVNGGTLTIEGARLLALNATNATVSAADIGSARVRASGSTVELDLQKAVSSPDLDFGAGTNATVVLGNPCVINLDNAEEARGRVALVGCQIFDGKQRVPVGSNKRAVLTRAKVAPGASVEVRSGP